MIRLAGNVKRVRTKYTAKNGTLARCDAEMVSRSKVRKEALKGVKFKRGKGLNMPPTFENLKNESPREQCQAFPCNKFVFQNF